MEYKQIPGHENYALSKDGSMRRLKRNGQTEYVRFKEKDGQDYPLYGVDKKIYTVHSLVMLTWGQPRPSLKHIIRHLDDNKNNPHIDNLAWGTAADNVADKIRNHMAELATARYHKKAKYTLLQVLEVMRAVDSCKSPSLISKELNVPIRFVYSIKSGNTYKAVRKYAYPIYCDALDARTIDMA